jgi:ligand-binding sensor domain-containing protein/serine phosphatase RsbU (regulator of sigma subunit)
LRLYAKIVSFLFIGILCNNTYAQNRPDLRFRNLSIESGLSQSSVNAIIQDKEGYMWFGTQDGLNRYDGFSFTIFKNESDDTNSISSGHVRALLEDKNGTIWIGTESGGLNAYNKLNGSFTKFLAQSKNTNSLSNNHVRCMLQSTDGTLWLGTNGGGINQFNPKTKQFTRLTGFLSNASDVSRIRIESIAEDGKGNIWAGTYQDGLICYNKQTKNWKQYLPENKPCALNNLRITSIYIEKNTIWAGTYGGGLHKMNIEKECFEKNYHQTNGLNNNFILNIYPIENQLWIGTYGGGLNILDKKNEQFFHYSFDADDETSISNNDVWTIFKNREGVIYLGTDGGGINIFDKISQKFLFYRNHPKLPSISNNIVRCLFEDSKGVLWIGTYGGGLNSFDKNKNQYLTYKNDLKNLYSISNDRVVSILESNGYLWFGTDGGGLNKFDRNSGKFTSYQHNPSNENTISNNVIWCMSEEPGKGLWLGTRGGGLNFFDFSNETFTHYKYNPINKESISSDYTRVIADDKKGNLWIGTDGGGFSIFNKKTKSSNNFKGINNINDGPNNGIIRTIYIENEQKVWMGTDGGGLNLFDTQNKQFYYFTEKDGLPNNVIYGILPDEEGYLWLSTNKGLSKLKLLSEPSKRQLYIRNYDISDGLQNNEFNTGAYFKSKNGELFFGGISGFNKFFPKDVTDNKFEPPIMFTNFKVFEKNYVLDTLIQFKKKIVLSHTENFFSFNFSALSFSMPDKNKYAYKMEGFDKDWVQIGNRNYASYTNLDPGTYVFIVKGSNNDGIWNENGAKIHLIITPPFYKTWWFFMFVGVFIILNTIAYIKIRERSLRKEKLILERTVAQRTNELVIQSEEILLKNKELNRQQEEITDSINYAKRIQQAILPLQTEIKEELSESFVFYLPKDIVSGDFYWYKSLDKHTKLIAAADCTGHGVPGAFMSMIGVDKLNEIVNQSTVPGEIIGNLNYAIKKALRQSSTEIEKNDAFATRDGMDIILCKINTETRVVDYSGANRALWIFKKVGDYYQWEDIKPNKCAVGGFTKENQIFVNHTIQLNEGDTLFLFTDGIVDQFGGDAAKEGKKLMSKKFRDMLMALQHLPLDIQAEYLEKQFYNWKGDLEQLDDVLVIGIRV